MEGVVRGILAIRAGDPQAAARTVRWLDSIPVRFGQQGQGELLRAKVLATAGDRDGAIHQLRDAVRRGRSPAFFLHKDLDLLPLRSDPAFQELVRPRR
jgi:CHAD domain-containing protein